MIVELLFRFVIGFLDIIFGWVEFPPMPEAVVTSLDAVLDAISSAIGFIWLIAPRELVLVVLPVILVVENFDKLYSVVMWIVKKIPFLGMK